MNGKSNLVSPALALTPTKWSDQKKRTAAEPDTPEHQVMPMNIARDKIGKRR